MAKKQQNMIDAAKIRALIQALIDNTEERFSVKQVMEKIGPELPKLNNPIESVKFQLTQLANNRSIQVEKVGTANYYFRAQKGAAKKVVVKKAATAPAAKARGQVAAPSTENVPDFTVDINKQTNRVRLSFPGTNGARGLTIEIGVN